MTATIYDRRCMSKVIDFADTPRPPTRASAHERLRRRLAHVDRLTADQAALIDRMFGTFLNEPPMHRTRTGMLKSSLR
jgi:hypothetical protein